MPPKFVTIRHTKDKVPRAKGAQVHEEEPGFVAIEVEIPDDAPACQMCGKKGVEIRPFGPNHESICAECAEKDPETTERRWRELNPDG